jgi:hypothetical protein
MAVMGKWRSWACIPYIITIIHIQNQNKVVEFLVALHHATCLEDVPISYDQSLLKGIVANRY